MIDLSPVYPWQRDQWLQLLGQFQQGRLPHAILLQGMPGLGKRQFAENLMQAFLCVGEGAQKPCGHCKSCLLFASETHPDCLVLDIEKDRKSILISQLRELVGFLAQKAQQLSRCFSTPIRLGALSSSPTAPPSPTTAPIRTSRTTPTPSKPPSPLRPSISPS